MDSATLIGLGLGAWAAIGTGTAYLLVQAAEGNLRRTREALREAHDECFEDMRPAVGALLDPATASAMQNLAARGWRGFSHATPAALPVAPAPLPASEWRDLGAIHETEAERLAALAVRNRDEAGLPDFNAEWREYLLRAAQQQLSLGGVHYASLQHNNLGADFQSQTKHPVSNPPEQSKND